MSGDAPLESITAGHLCYCRAGWMYHEIKALGIGVFRSKIIVEQPGLCERITHPLQKRGVHAFGDVTLKHRYNEGTTRCRCTVFGVRWINVSQARRRDQIDPDVLRVKVVKLLKHVHSTLCKRSSRQGRPLYPPRQGVLLSVKGQLPSNAASNPVVLCEHSAQSCVVETAPLR